MNKFLPQNPDCGVFVEKMQVRSDARLCLSILNNKTLIACKSAIKPIIDAIESFSFAHNKTSCDKITYDCLPMMGLVFAQINGWAR